jgi:undecaprenyl diphosphate synthase
VSGGVLDITIWLDLYMQTHITICSTLFKVGKISRVEKAWVILNKSTEYSQRDGKYLKKKKLDRNKMVLANFNQPSGGKLKDYKDLTRNKFLKLSTKEISKIVRHEGRPKVGVFIPDGTRRSAMFFLGLKPDDNDFEEKYIEIEGKKFLENTKIIFDHGLHTLFIPSLKHENYDRKKKSIDAIIYSAIKSMLIGDDWLEFYDKYGVKVKVYGDLDFVTRKGYPEVTEWAKEIEKRTKHNKKHRIFNGIACSNRYELPRLMDLAIDFYINNNRKPTDKEKIRLYYDEDVDDVDFLIRATAVRDSDIQPPIISGRKTQMYFFVAPNHISFSTEVFREILYDLLYCRSPVFGNLSYSNSILKKINVEYIKNYYLINRSEILGVGEKIGPFWVPRISIKMPKNQKGDESFNNK